jgi:hypothetical protein
MHEKKTQNAFIMNQLDKEKWVEDILDSLEGIHQPQMPEGLYENAMRRAAFGPARIIRMPAAQVWNAAACALVLIVANLYICLDFSASDNKAVGSKEMFAKEYFGSSDAPNF